MNEVAKELEGWRRYAALFGGMLVSGFLCTLAIPFLIAPTGTIGPTALQSQSALPAVVATFLLFGLAVVVAGYVGRGINAAVGMFVLGSGLWILRLRSATIADLAFADGSLTLVAFETLLWGVLILGATFAVFRLAGPLDDITPESGEHVWWRTWGLPGAAAGLLAPVGVMLIARSPLAGQTLMAVVLGSMATGLVGRLISPGAQPYLLFAAPCIFGGLGQLIGALQLTGPLPNAFVEQTVSALSRPMPIDYAAGSLMGVAMGLGWAKGFLHHEETP